MHQKYLFALALAGVAWVATPAPAEEQAAPQHGGGNLGGMEMPEDVQQQAQQVQQQAQQMQQQTQQVQQQVQQMPQLSQQNRQQPQQTAPVPSGQPGTATAAVPVAGAPQTFDMSGGQQVPSGPGAEQANPRLLGMELPLLDPASDTVKYNGGFFDIGNNAAVRARFEKYLQQAPDNSTESNRYRKKLNELLKLTQKTARSKAAVGSETMVRIGRGLYEINDYPGDGGQSGTLASGIASALAVQFANNRRDRENDNLQRDIDKLVKDTNRLTNQNTGRSRAASAKVSNKGGNATTPNTATTHTFLIQHNTSEVAGKKASQVKNDADSMTQLELAKVNYQSMMLSFLFERRFDHALMGANCYRHIFRDGDTQLKLDENSKSFKLFNGIAGTAPTVSAIASMAANARHDVDQNIEAVNALLAQNRLGDATQHLIEAVAIGEFMQSVATFPVEGRRRIAEYWSLRRRALTSLNARDYDTCEDIAKKMKELDADFDDSLLLSYCTGRKMQSDMALRNALKAFKAGDEEKAQQYITEAGTIWPRNPKLTEGRTQLEKMDSQDGVLDEFRTLFARGDYRTIFNEQERFEVVALDPELKKQYKEAITLISTIDGMIRQLDAAAKQDEVMGPCLAYEMLLKQEEQDERYAKDARFNDAKHRFALGAHDFVQSLKKGEQAAESGELGSALACYYRALCLYPRSELAKKGADEVTKRLLRAKF